MVKIRKYANVIERFLHGEKGQRFFNFAYSIGAAVVIWGALFKILHLPGGSLLLCIGMGTEIAMFVLTAFDRPPREYAWEEVFPALDGKHEENNPDFVSQPSVAPEGGSYPAAEYSESSAGVAMPVAVPRQSPVQSPVAAPDQVPDLTGFADVSDEYVSQMQSIAEQMAKLNETYTEHMQDLNRNVAGLNTIYEIQLKSISSQLETIDKVNRGLKDIRDMYEKSANESSRYCEETEKMARYMRQLNAVYEKMITAMTINMQNPMMGTAGVNPFDTEEKPEN
jgi:gliding motility-associated protein GldL